MEIFVAGALVAATAAAGAAGLLLPPLGCWAAAAAELLISEFIMP